MFFSVSRAFQKKRTELNQVAMSQHVLTSKETIHQSEQLDHFVNLYQNRDLPELEISKDIKDTTLTITIKGQLDLATSDILTSYVDTKIDKWKSITELYINIVGLKFFDTSGIRSLVLLILEARKNNVSVKTITTNESTIVILNVMGVPEALKKSNCGVFKVQ